MGCLFDCVGRDMTIRDFSDVHESLLQTDSKSTRLFARGRFRRAYRLIGIPLVYHVLPNQGSQQKRPSMTNEQRDFATNETSRLYNIYNKRTKRLVQFASFVTNDTIVHSNFTTKDDCFDLSSAQLSSIVTRAADWQFKMHVIVCEFAQVSGVATLPFNFRATDPQHNLLRVDHRALGCYTDDGTFLCNLTNGQQVSHSRWWRTRSHVLAHEIGHLFGLLHTFTGRCLSLDRIADTPAEDQGFPFGCPGLLPYDRDRNLFAFSGRKEANTGGNASTCVGGQSDVCGATCAACCVPDDGNADCTLGYSNGESVSEEQVSFPDCCRGNSEPIDTCKLRRGIDPLNNIMSYSPDFCGNEFTPGQMARMMTRTRSYKPYIYCNYGSRQDSRRCRNVPCHSGATSPNCR
jgi:Pregnancy-associated plasma protein-A